MSDRQTVPSDEDPRTAESDVKAVDVSQWRNSATVAMGNKQKEEWILSRELGTVNLEDCR